MSIDNNFIEKLSKKYESQKNGKELWEKEEDKVIKILSSVKQDISNRYKFDSPINIGGTAIIIKVHDSNLNIYQALKCARPVAGKEPLLAKIITSEISRLTEASHQNIVSIFYKGDIALNEERWPYYIMEYIEGGLDACDYIDVNKPDYNIIIKILQNAVEGLFYLHSRNIIHGDVKLENLLVTPAGRAKITDLGSARILTGEEEETQITFTRPFAHPELRNLVSETYVSDPNRSRAKIQRGKLKKTFDLYALGKNIFRMLNKYDIADFKKFPYYHREYLNLMGSRLLDGYNSDDECALNLPKNIYKEIKYSSAQQVLIDIKKLTGEYSIHEIISELDHHYPKTIQISSPSATSFPQRIANFLSLPIVRRLSSLSQLGLIVQIYPTATHSRLEHLMGTFSNVTRYIDSLWNDHINPLFKQIITEHDVKLALLGGLCHDLGQYPLAHDLEEAEGKIFSHREICQKMLTEFSEENGLKKLLKEDWDVEAQEVALLLSANPSDLSKPFKLRLLHTLIDGPIDADKVDYLIRDSTNLNVPYGKAIDFERLLKCLTVVFKAEGNRTFVSLGIHEKGKTPAEAIAFARYTMFGSVYWHHTSRALKSMLHRSIWEALPDKDRRSKEYHDLHKMFLDWAVKEIRIKPTESLFPQYRTGKLPGSPLLSMPDYEMLAWIYERTSEAGKKLLEMICERRVFKRILVISERKNASLWENLTDLRNNYNWNVVIDFQNRVQSKLINIIDSLEEEQRITTVLSKNKTDEIVGRAAKGEVLFLIDIPTERKGSSIDLYYLTESRIAGRLKSTEESVLMEDSVVWNDLSRNFLKSVGKIRIFSHPDIVETCNACLERDLVEGIIEMACREAKS